MANRNAGYGARRGGFWFYLSRAGANDSSGRVSKFLLKKPAAKSHFLTSAAARQIMPPVSYFTQLHGDMLLFHQS